MMEPAPAAGAGPLDNLQRDAADLRRDQLLDIATRLIELEGIDAVKHARIAKLAGCTRSLVYHYFPKRADLFAGVSQRFYERLDAVIPVEAQQAALRQNLEGDKDSSRALFGLLFDLLEDGGYGSLILRTTPELDREFATEGGPLHDENEMRWIGVIAERFGMDPVDGELFFQHSLNITKTIFLFYRRGQLSKPEAVEKIDITLNQLLGSYR